MVALLPTLARIKCIAQEEIEVVHGDGEFPVCVGGFPVEADRLEARAGLVEAGGQGQGRVGVAQNLEQTVNRRRELPSLLNRFQSAFPGDATGHDILQQQALEFATVPGAVGIDATAVSFERGARLTEHGGPRVRSLAAGGETVGNEGEAELFEAARIVTGLQLQVGKEHPIAAEAAGRAKLLNHRAACSFLSQWFQFKQKSG